MEWLVNHNTPELLFEIILNIGRQNADLQNRRDFPESPRGSLAAKTYLAGARNSLQCRRLDHRSVL